jgi:DNA-binding LacI/PurR family transcriptional regulator
LTTVKLHQRRCGAEAAKLLLELIGETEGEAEAEAGESAGHKSIKLGYKIIERESL